MNNNHAIQSILIVGGGAAGWLTAGIIAARYGNAVGITLIESSEIPTIGVGEGSWPSMRNTLRDMGIAESDFFRECDASFKQGVKFINWQSEQNSFFYHPFSLPIGFIERNTAAHWLQNPVDKSFADAVSSQELLCEKNLAPRAFDTADYKSFVNYGYHLDAGKFITFLREHCKTRLGVKHIIGTIRQVNQHESGIASVETMDNQTLSADLFVDCSGLKSLMLGETFGTPFVDKSDQMFIDSAVAVQVPYENEDSPILPYTISHAQKSGWIWDIGLYTRRGIGHVYSSRHMSEDEAVSILKAHAGPASNDLTPRKISIPCGHREKFWVKNCVGVGMAAGFIEPLEASALVMVELAAQYIRDQLPQHKDVMPIVAKRFNELQTYRWERIVDFLKLHYVLSERTSDFWVDNRNPDTFSDSLKEALALWQYHVPYKRDFLQKEEMFPVASYQYILYGMGFKTQTQYPHSASEQAAFLRQAMENEKIKAHLASISPDTRELLKAIRNR